KWQNDGITCLKSDDLVKPFYDRGIVELVDFLWDFERYGELKRWNDNVKRNRVVFLKKAMIKEVVEIEEKINKVWNIRQRDDESILAYTYRYESLVVLVESMCPITYDEAKEWALELEAEINDGGIQGIEIGDYDVNVRKIGVDVKQIKHGAVVVDGKVNDEILTKYRE
ncbi:9388_t:CDS:2, partial [Racocetra persica]